MHVQLAKKSAAILGVLLMAGLLHAQSFTTSVISAQKLVDINKQPLNGTVTITLTDRSDNPVTYTPQSGSPSTAPFTANVKNGAIQPVAGFPYAVPAAATTAPTGIVYRIQTRMTNSVLVWTLPTTPISNQFYSIDGYIAQAATPVFGTGIPTIPHCAPGALYTDTTSPAIPYGCSKFTVPDNSTMWTQSPSQNPMCSNGAVAYPFTGSPYCVPATTAYALPGYVIGNNSSTPAQPYAIPNSGGGGGACTGLLGELTAVGPNGSCVGTPTDWNQTNPGSYTALAPWIFDSQNSNSVPVIVRGAGGGFATPTPVANSGATAGGHFFSCDVTAGTTIPAGATIFFVAGGQSGGTGGGAATDSLGNIYTLLSVPHDYAIWKAFNTTTGIPTISTGAVSELSSCSTFSYTGISQLSPLDVLAQSDTFANPWTIGPINTNFANELILSVFANAGSLTSGTVPGYTNEYFGSTGASGFGWVAQIVNTTGSYSATWTTNASSTNSTLFLLGLKAQGSDTQTDDLVQYQNSEGTVLAGVNGNGQHYDPANVGLPTDPPESGTYPWCFDTSDNTPCYWNGSAWVHIGSGSGGGIGGTVSAPFLPVATGPDTLGNSLAQDNGHQLSYAGDQGLALIGVAGVGASASLVEGTEGCTPATGLDCLWSNIATHRLTQNPNDIGELVIPGVGTPITPGHLFAAAANGTDMVDGGTGGGGSQGFGTLTVDVETYSGANAGAKLIACLADGTLAPGTICDMRGILNEGTQPVSLGTAPIEVGRSGPQSVLWPSCIGPTNSHCGAVLNTASTTLATPSAPTIACSTTGGGYHSAGVTVFAKVNYRTGDAVSASSSEASCTLASTTTGMITVTGPASCPTYTSEYDVSLSLTTGAETKQMNAVCGSTAVFTSQDLFPVSSAAPSSATALPCLILHNNKSEFYALHSGQNGFPFYTSGSTTCSDMLATTDNGYSGISNIFLYNNGGGTITHGMADNGVYKSSIRDNINISAGSVDGLHLFGQYNDVTWTIPQFGCSSNSCTPLVIEWSPQTVGDGESLNTIGFDGMLISTKANASNTGSGIKITGRSGAGSTFWSSVGSGVGGINITNSSLEMGAAAVNGILATDFNNLNFSGSKITRASFGGTAALNINQTYHQTGQAYQSGPVSVNNTSHIDGFTDVVLNNVSTDTAMTIAATSGVSFDNNYYWGGGTNSLASPPYSDVKGDVPVYLGDASPLSVNNANCRGTCTGFGTGGVPAITNTSSTTPVGIHNTTPLDSLDIAGFMNDMTGAVAVATLNGNCSNVATSCSITVSSGTIPASGYVEFVDGTAEFASFSAGTSTALGGLTRGIWNTSGNSHNNGNNVWIIPWAVSSTNSLPPYLWVTGQGGLKVDSGPSTNDNNSANTIEVENFWASFGGFCFGNSYSGPCMNSDGSNGFKFVDSSGNIVWAADSTGATAVKEVNLAVTSGTTTLTPTSGIANLTGTAPTAVATITPLASCTETGVGCFQTFTGVGATLVTSGNILVGGTFAVNTEWGCTYNQAATKWSCYGASSAGGALNVNGTPVSSPNLQDSATATLGVSGSDIQVNVIGGTTSPEPQNTVYAGPASASASQIVQSASGVCDNCSPATATLSAPVTPGHLLVLTISTFGATTPTDSVGDTFTQAVTQGFGVNNYIYYTCNAIGGATTVSVSGGRSVQIAVMEVQGNPTSSCLDTFGQSTYSSSPFSLTASTAVAQPNELVVSSFESDSGACLVLKPDSVDLQVAQTFSGGSGSGNWPFLTQILNSNTGLSGNQTVGASCSNLSVSFGTGLISTFKLSTPAVTALPTFRPLVTADLPIKTKCASTASPAVCGANQAGTVQVAASATALTVNTTAVGSGSTFSFDYTTAAAGCGTAPTNVTSLITPYVSAITSGVSFTITLPVAPVVNAACIQYTIF